VARLIQRLLREGHGAVDQSSRRFIRRAAGCRNRVPRPDRRKMGDSDARLNLMPMWAHLGMSRTRNHILNGQGAATERASGSRETSGQEDVRLFALVRAGDVQAFEAFYRLYHPRLTRFLLRLVRRPQLIEEILDDTLMVVWERGDSFNGASKLSTWIFGIAYRKAMNALSRQDEPVEDRDLDDRISPAASPEEELGQHKIQALLREAMKELSPEHRTVLDLTYHHEMGYREIAQIMSCPVDTVKTRMFHARRHLRRRLAGEFADWL
jgi:RNA polymerase sigma-70 factor (ECF subfamily)